MNTAATNRRDTVLDRDAITRLVHRFYDDVRADASLGPTFDAVLHGRWDAHLPRMVEFWSTVLLGSRSFSGNVLATHMAVPGVLPQHFGRWLTLWFARTGAQFEPDAAVRLQQVALGIARNLYRGRFGDDAGFDAIESALQHACR